MDEMDDILITDDSFMIDLNLPRHNDNDGSMHRGFIDDHGHVLLQCSGRYLHILTIEVHRAWGQSVIEEVDTTDDGGKERRLIFLSSELDRLLNHPELFPSNELRCRFLSTLALDSELQFHNACATHLVRSELDDLTTLTQREYTRPTYGDEAVGWENFLLNMAPGAPNDPTDRAHTAPKTSFQVIPPVGMRIISDINQEEKGIVKFMDENKDRLDVSAAPTTLLVDFDKKLEPGDAVPGFSLPQLSDNATVRPNPFRQNSGSMPEGISTTMTAERIGPFMHKLENPPAAVNGPVPSLHVPDVFPMVSVRSWHPPARSWDIRYDHSRQP